MPFKSNYSFPAPIGPPKVEKKKSEDKAPALKNSKSQGGTIGGSSIQKQR